MYSLRPYLVLLVAGCWWINAAVFAFSQDASIEKDPERGCKGSVDFSEFRSYNQWTITGPFLLQCPGKPLIIVVKAEAPSIKLKPTIPAVIVIDPAGFEVLGQRNEFQLMYQQILLLSSGYTIRLGENVIEMSYDLAFMGDVEDYVTNDGRPEIGDLIVIFRKKTESFNEAESVGNFTLAEGSVIVFNAKDPVKSVQQRLISTEPLLEIDFSEDDKCVEKVYAWWEKANQSVE